MLSGHCMGTSWTVHVLIGDDRSPQQLHRLVAERLESIEFQMSHFRKDSALTRFAQVDAGAWMTLPADFARVMAAAMEIAQMSDGAFDPAVAKSIDAWGFGSAIRFSDEDFCPPPWAQDNTRDRPQGIAQDEAQHLRAWQALRLDTSNRLFQPGGAHLNLAAIAKGYAVDAVSRLLTASGLQNHLVEVGGELRGAGMKPDFQPWWVVLESPSDVCLLPATRVALHGLAVATSGDYRRQYQHEGRKAHHTIDPRTGRPVENGVVSVTVIHEECMLADAWATALMVLGVSDGMALAERHGLAVCFRWLAAEAGWQEVFSTAFARLER